MRLTVWRWQLIVGLLSPQASSHAYGGHSSHVTNVTFLHEDSHLISTGGKDMSIMQWRLLWCHQQPWRWLQEKIHTTACLLHFDVGCLCVGTSYKRNQQPPNITFQRGKNLYQGGPVALVGKSLVNVFLFFYPVTQRCEGGSENGLRSCNGCIVLLANSVQSLFTGLQQSGRCPAFIY